MKKLLFVLLLLFSFVACENHVANCDSTDIDTITVDSVDTIVVDTLN